MAILRFRRGQINGDENNLPQDGLAGEVFLATDDKSLFFSNGFDTAGDYLGNTRITDIEYVATLPAQGNKNKLYVQTTENKLYRFDEVGGTFQALSSTQQDGLTLEEAQQQFASINHTHTEYAVKASEHSHTNKAELDRLGVNAEGKILVDGTPVPSSSVQINDTTPALDKVYSSKKTSDELALKAAANHTHSEYSPTNHNHSGVYEPVISTKGTAFNKNFGTSGVSNDVARADHAHTDYTTVTAVNQIIADSVSLRDSNILLNGDVLETTIDGSKIGIEFNLLAEPLPNVQDGLSEATAYIIQTVQDLLDIPTKGLNKYYKLWQSLDLSGIEWVSLGATAFTGHFNGNGKILSNMTTTSATKGTGLFTELQTGSIKNLIISGANITTNKVNSGVVVGKKTSGTVDNVFVVNSTISATNYNIGFIAGNNLAGSITKSGVLNGTLTIGAGSYNTSLFVGDNRAVIREVFATGTINVNNNAAYTGAFAGILGTGSDIDDVYTVVTFAGTYPGLTTGFTSNFTGTINNTYTKVNRAKYTFFSGGAGTLTNGYYNVATLEASPTLQGTSVSDLSNQSSFVGFDFSTPIWKMDTSKGRPVLNNVKEDVSTTETPTIKSSFANYSINSAVPNTMAAGTYTLIQWNDKIRDTKNEMVNGVFTPTEYGFYDIEVNLTVLGSSANTNIHINLNIEGVGDRKLYRDYVEIAKDAFLIKVATTVELQAGQEIKVNFYPSTSGVSIERGAIGSNITIIKRKVS